MTRPPVRFKSFLLPFLVLTLCLANVQAQQSNPPSKEADEALRQKAFDLLKSVAGQLGSLQSAENRARIGANVADSLWQRDEERARALFVSVQDDINAGLQTRAGDAATESQRRMIFFQLRMNTVERIAKHDGVLALSFFKATTPPVVERNQADYPVDETSPREREFA